MPLARVLAALSDQHTIRRVVDPMAGTGDLLDAIIERDQQGDCSLERVSAIEVDAATARVCEERLRAWHTAAPVVTTRVVAGSAFDVDVVLDACGVENDLVITNPPYVRYQTVSQQGQADGGQTLDAIRDALASVARESQSESDRAVWRELIRGFSGLADLSVPSWLLAGMLVRPGGTLALVAPATWRSRDYADVLQYMLARFFNLEVVVADTQPGWFSEALVRTHLVVARRRDASGSAPLLRDRRSPVGRYHVVEIEPGAAAGGSLVGGAFDSPAPESAFASRVYEEPHSIVGIAGIRVAERPFADENKRVLALCERTRWLTRVEPDSADLPLFATGRKAMSTPVPDALREVLPAPRCELSSLDHLGIRVGQGLRTGCNEFFYVTIVAHEGSTVRVQTSKLFGNEELSVPASCLQPVVRRQSELDAFRSGAELPGRLLDLRLAVLPEDATAVEQSREVFAMLKQPPPEPMPEALAAHVRRAALARRGDSDTGKLIPELSAVATNVREPRTGPKPQTPRFWYMIPDFARRHLPDAFVPRVNQRAPKVLPNRSPRVLIDANFSTIWADTNHWPPDAVVALMNSTWIRACMEAVGTPMGGGALKLEATHLRRIPVPRIADGDGLMAALAAANSTEAVDDAIFLALTGERAKASTVKHLLIDATSNAQKARHRK